MSEVDVRVWGDGEWVREGQRGKDIHLQIAYKPRARHVGDGMLMHDINDNS